MYFDLILDDEEQKVENLEVQGKIQGIIVS